MNDPANPKFTALGDPTRRQILEWLDSGDSTTATELAARFPITRQAITKHLKDLESANLITSVKEGRETRYSINIDGLDPVAAWLDARGAAWDNRLARLSDLSMRDTEN